MVIYGHMKAKSLLSTKNTPPQKKKTDKKNKNKIGKQRKKKTRPLRNVPPSQISHYYLDFGLAGIHGALILSVFYSSEK